MTAVRYFATCAKGLEYLLVDELKALGAEEAREALAGVHFSGDAALGLRACLWSRLASRILLPLAEFDARDAQALYDGIHAIDWNAHLDPGRSFAIDAGVRLSSISQSMFAGQKAKDAIVDQIRQRHGERPNVDTEAPDVRINLRLVRDRAAIAIDLSGAPLHRRGWRSGQGEAPLKETVAAAMLLRAGWPQLAQDGKTLLDPFCGVGTLVIEAAWMATDTAPGLLRGRFACERWLGFDEAIAQGLLREARERRDQGMLRWQPGRLHGSDLNARLVDLAREHAGNAGVAELVSFRHTDARRRPAAESAPDLVVANLPFGERLGDDASTRTLYGEFGQALREHYGSAHAALLTLADGRGKALGLRARKRYALSNGALDCELLLIDLAEAARVAPAPELRPLSDGAQMVANRLGKNHRHLHKRLEREGITCYRIYDADLPEYAAAIDLYEGHAVIQEYQAPVEIPAETARRRLGEIVRATQAALAIPRERIVVKTRQRQRRGEQYQARDAARTQAPIIAGEGGLRFEIRLDDYLDTGLYLDHRLVRQWIGANASGKDFLNLFCYTGAATVHAAAGGARSTTSVDLSATYLNWAQRNLQLNDQTGSRHRLVQADVMRWLGAVRDRFDLIYVDPPTFSNSKRADEDFDVQRQHVALLDACGDHLKSGGVIIFSNHFRKFRMDHEVLSERFAIQDLGPRMLPFDFARDPRIHQVFELRLKSSG